MDEKKLIRRLSAVGVIGNLTLSVLKLLAGSLGCSDALISDAVHSFADVFATLTAYIGVRLARRPPDSRHPYGYDRCEGLAAMLLGCILLITGCGIGCSGFSALFRTRSEPLPTAEAFFAALFSFAVKDVMFLYTRRLALRLRSAAFLADAWHHHADALASLASLLSICGAMLGFPASDSIGSILIGMSILKTGCDILKSAAAQVLDVSCPCELEAALRETVQMQSDVISVKALRTRQFGRKLCADLELLAPSELSLEQTEVITEKIRQAVTEKYPAMQFITVQYQPQRCGISTVISSRTDAPYDPCSSRIAAESR